MDHVASYQTAMDKYVHTIKVLQLRSTKETNREALSLVFQETIEFLDTIEHEVDDLHRVWDSYRNNDYYRALTREVRTLRKEIVKNQYQGNGPYYNLYRAEKYVQKVKDDAQILLNTLIKKAFDLREEAIADKLQRYDASKFRIDSPWPN